MNWDQIETNWAAMTRRVRPDWPALAEEAVDALPFPDETPVTPSGLTRTPAVPDGPAQEPARVPAAVA